MRTRVLALLVSWLAAPSGGCSRPRHDAVPSPPALDAGIPPAAVVASGSKDAAAPPPAGSPIVPTLTLAPPPADRHPYKWSLKTEGLPALSADGHHAVVVVDQPDGGRGYPSNQLVVLSVDRDKVEKKLPLLVADEFATQSESISPAEAGAIEHKIARRLETARTELAKTSWVSLAQLRPSAAADADAAKSNEAWGPAAGIEVSLASGRLRARDGTSVVLDRDVRAWTLPSYKIRDFAPCTFELAPNLVAVDPTRHVLVLVVTQALTEGGDQCSSPNDAHAVKLNP